MLAKLANELAADRKAAAQREASLRNSQFPDLSSLTKLKV